MNGLTATAPSSAVTRRDDKNQVTRARLVCFVAPPMTQSAHGHRRRVPFQPRARSLVATCRLRAAQRVSRQCRRKSSA